MVLFGILHQVPRFVLYRLHFQLGVAVIGTKDRCLYSTRTGFSRPEDGDITYVRNVTSDTRYREDTWCRGVAHTVKSTCVNVFALSKKMGYSRLGWKRIATTHL
jgi:hypothetical protein